MRRIILLVVSLFPLLVHAKQFSMTDSSRTTGSPHKPLRKKTVVQKDDSVRALFSPDARIIPFAEQNRYFFEEFSELFERWPAVQKIKLGDVGYPAYLGLAGAPYRLTTVQIDDISWPLDVYGRVNFTALPETAADWIVLEPLQQRLRFYGDEQPVRTTWTYFEYVDGPYGSDAMRVRFRRPLSQKLSTSWSATFANAEPFLPATLGTEGEFNTQKFRGRFTYHLSKPRGWTLQHRFLKTVAERGIVEPIAFEEWPNTQQATEKVYRLSHQLELVKRQSSQEGERQLSTADWKIGLFYWDVRQEFRDDRRDVWFPHRRQFWGVRGQWSPNLPSFPAVLAAQWQTIGYDSSSIQEERQQEAKATIRIQSSPLRSFLWQLELMTKYRSRFGFAYAFDARLVWQVRPTLSMLLSLQQKTIYPEVGEYANTVPDILLPNFDLIPMQVSAVHWQLQGQWNSLEFQAALSYYRLSKAFDLTPVDSLWQLMNLQGDQAYPAVNLAVNWRPIRNGLLKLWMVKQWQPPAEDYLFWFMPQTFARGEARMRFILFGGDLPAEGLLRASYYGQRTAPVPGTGVPSLKMAILDGFWQMDLALRLHFRDAIIFLNFDNLLNQQGFWRVRQPIRGRTFRLGINWLLLD